MQMLQKKKETAAAVAEAGSLEDAVVVRDSREFVLLGSTSLAATQQYVADQTKVLYTEHQLCGVGASIKLVTP